jgi:hypothetical protein
LQYETYRPPLRLQAAIRKFCSIEAWERPVAATLTMKQGLRLNGMYIGLTRELCSQNLRHALNVLDKRCFRNAARRKQLKCVAILEQDASDRWHYHLALDRPPRVDQFHFDFLVKTVWWNTMWGHNQIELSFDADDGWIRYVTKLRSKAEYDEAIDWANCRLTDLKS